MDKYYENKILYALGKIDYALSKKNNDKNLKALSKIYSVLLTYNGTVKLELLMSMTGLDRETIVSKLRDLKTMGVVDWDGVYLNTHREIKKGRKDIKEWYYELMTNLKKSGSNLTPEDEDFITKYEQEVKDASVAEHFEQVRQKVDTAFSSSKSDWIEIDIEDGIKIRVTRQKLKERLLGGN